MLILIVILLFALFAIAGLLIDIGMARLTQAHMQSVSDAASLEGGWQLAMGANQTTTRIAVVDRAAEMSESWGPHRIELEDGYNLGGSGKPESSQTINRDTLGDPVRPMLDPNVDNDLEGDIVLGKYCDCRENTECWKEFQLNPLPGQPVGYGRGKMFEPTDFDVANSVLVRLRRTGEDDLAGGTSAERLTYLWSRGSLLDFGLKGDGIAVRSESIAKLAPAVAVGILPETETQLSAIPVSISIDDWNGLLLDTPASPATLTSFGNSPLLEVPEMLLVGTSTAAVQIDRTAVGLGYVSIVNGDQVIVGFGLADVSETETGAEPNLQIEKLASAMNANASANPALLEMSSLSILVEQEDVVDLVSAPVLVRSQQIQGGTP
ncbi:hypothetical protein RBSWK_03047 [Rhodopirellula baltica SWK14]|uniref:Putative Flp pilus-assembly TadG-like N-terminal domain-containing protein n=1 Tax=Rhodopirellula baltica SWK14 TaxID=993516 RepID=L7CJE9_RHOBT|nr:hypothetical protein RBSWK_03047 [Rhodopirellula baltica SWK14]